MVLTKPDSSTQAAMFLNSTLSASRELPGFSMVTHDGSYPLSSWQCWGIADGALEDQQAGIVVSI